MPNRIFDSKYYFSGNNVTLIKGGQAYFEKMLAMLKSAKYTVHLHVYIFYNDATGRLIAFELKAAAKRGVKIYVLVDAFGSADLQDIFINELKKSGVLFEKFSPLFVRNKIRFGRRLHSKILVVDEQHALLGGINIADKYRGDTSNPPWLDFAVCVEGNVCIDLTHICSHIFNKKYKRTQLSHSKNSPINGAMLRLSLNDWLRGKDQISIGYKRAFAKAQSSIVIVASYFLPGTRMRILLKNATRRGVEITLILPGESDSKIMKRAMKWLYPWLVRNNIKIMEWSQSVLHAKMAVVDTKWVTVGSYNLNHLSHYSSIELNMEVLDATFASEATTQLNEILSLCEEVTDSSINVNSPLISKLANWFAYQLIRLSMKLLFLFTSAE